VKRAIASRVAAKLREDGARVEMKRGGFGELRVNVDGKDAYDGNRLMYTTPGRVLRAVRDFLRETDGPDAG
jgi:hypothetical protein